MYGDGPQDITVELTGHIPHHFTKAYWRKLLNGQHELNSIRKKKRRNEKKDVAKNNKQNGNSKKRYDPKSSSLVQTKRSETIYVTSWAGCHGQAQSTGISNWPNVATPSQTPNYVCLAGLKVPVRSSKSAFSIDNDTRPSQKHPTASSSK